MCLIKNVYKIKLTAKDSSQMLLNTFRWSHNFSNSEKLNDTLSLCPSRANMPPHGKGRR